MRTRLITVFVAVLALLGAGLSFGAPSVVAGPGEEYEGPYYGAGNFPPGCTAERAVGLEHRCHHMRVDMNGLDSPKVDVLVLVPVSATAERDMRIMRQSVEMWESGIDYLAGEMGLDWLADGMDFHVTVDYVDLAGDGNGGEFTTYPVVDPEIVVIATNPVGGAGIGVDPVAYPAMAARVMGLDIVDEDLVPCHSIPNPFDFGYWESLPGFNSHHEARTGTFTEDCGGSGGNVCFAVNGAIDPAPGTQIDFFQLFDLVSHEFGHCLTIGHVGDAGDGTYDAVPTNDIMSYNADPPGLSKCVSTLDVEGVALRMSRYLDVDGNGAVDGLDHLVPNDLEGDELTPFQVQHPDDHLYASATGSPLDCPQPDVGLVPGERTDWTPTPVPTTANDLRITSPSDGAVSEDGAFEVTGTVERRKLSEPAAPSGHYDDAPDDATTPYTEITALDVEVTTTTVDATIQLADLFPSTDVGAVTYSVNIDGRRFDSYIDAPVFANPQTIDVATFTTMPDGTSTWDLDAKTVTFRIPRDYLRERAVEAPYFVSSHSNIGTAYSALFFENAEATDDRAPEATGRVGVSNAALAPLLASAQTTTFEREGGNTFGPEDSTIISPSPTGDSVHHYGLDVAGKVDVEFTLSWTTTTGLTDLDLRVTGAADSGSSGAGISNPESFVLRDVEGHLDISVTPALVTDPLGTTYTLTATFLGDRDRDGVLDADDHCPDAAGSSADGCPLVADEHVHVAVNGVRVASQDVDTAYGPDAFAMSVTVAPGAHELVVTWERDGTVYAERGIDVTRTGGAVEESDSDGDGVGDAADNCPEKANGDQSDLDGDGAGDVCDSDMDGDGHSNGKERAHGTDPTDPTSFPGHPRPKDEPAPAPSSAPSSGTTTTTTSTATSSVLLVKRLF